MTSGCCGILTCGKRSGTNTNAISRSRHRSLAHQTRSPQTNGICAQRRLIIERTAELRLPAIYQPETVKDGGLAAFMAVTQDAWRSTVADRADAWRMIARRRTASGGEGGGRGDLGEAAAVADRVRGFGEAYRPIRPAVTITTNGTTPRLKELPRCECLKSSSQALK